MVDVVEDHFEVLVAEGGSRSSESNTPCDRFTAECGNPANVEVNVLLVDDTVELVGPC